MQFATGYFPAVIGSKEDYPKSAAVLKILLLMNL